MGQSLNIASPIAASYIHPHMMAGRMRFLLP